MPKIWYRNLNQAMISNLAPYLERFFKVILKCDRYVYHMIICLYMCIYVCCFAMVPYKHEECLLKRHELVSVACDELVFWCRDQFWVIMY